MSMKTTGSLISMLSIRCDHCLKMFAPPIRWFAWLNKKQVVFCSVWCRNDWLKHKKDGVF